MASDEEIHRKASALFGKLGAGLRSASKQVTGIGRGSVRLTLPSVRATPGGELVGAVALELPEPVAAKELRVTLKASQRTVEYRRVDGVRSAVTSSGEVYRFDLRLGGQQTYTSGPHQFSLTVPPDALDLRVSPGTGGGALGDIARTVASVVTPTAGPIQWQVIAVLDIAWGKNLTHAVDVTVVR